MPGWWSQVGFWAALPAVAAQGWWIRRNAIRLPEAAGADHGFVCGPTSGAPLRIVALGDSIIAGVGVATSAEALPAQLADALSSRLDRPVEWARFGRNGADSRALAEQLDRALARHDSIDLALISIGVNDATGMTPLRRYSDALDALRDRLHTHHPTACVVLASAPPLQAFPLLRPPISHWLGHRAARLNEAAAQFAGGCSRTWHSALPFAPERDRFAEDGFHPHAEACRDWAMYLADGIAARWPGLAGERRAADC